MNYPVIPAKVGIQLYNLGCVYEVDPRLRGNDGKILCVTSRTLRFK